jgi:hypothetical protein
MLYVLTAKPDTTVFFFILQIGTVVRIVVQGLTDTLIATGRDLYVLTSRTP